MTGVPALIPVPRPPRVAPPSVGPKRPTIH